MEDALQIEKFKYPIGQFSPEQEISKSKIKRYILDIEELPSLLNEATHGLSEEQLNTPYRPEGWTVRQVVHHIADSHLHGYMRCKWALTEDETIIKAYAEDKWAALPDSHQTPIAISIQLLTALHERWAVLLRSLKTEDLQKAFTHPEGNKKISLGEILGIYAWHGRHHLAHILSLKKRMEW